MAAAQVEPYQAKVAVRQAQRAAGKKPRGKEPAPPSAVPDPKAQYNFTDPESRIMKAGSGQHFEQAYNAQAAVDAAMIIVGEAGERRAQRQAGIASGRGDDQSSGGGGSPRRVGRPWILQCRRGGCG